MLDILPFLTDRLEVLAAPAGVLVGVAVVLIVWETALLISVHLSHLGPRVKR